LKHGSERDKKIDKILEIMAAFHDGNTKHAIDLSPRERSSKKRRNSYSVPC
jgi:hypothetical protein